MYIYFHRHDGRHQHCPPVQKHDAVISIYYNYYCRPRSSIRKVSGQGHISICFLICYNKIINCSYKLSICYYMLSICYSNLSMCYSTLVNCYYIYSFCYIKLLKIICNFHSLIYIGG